MHLCQVKTCVIQKLLNCRVIIITQDLALQSLHVKLFEHMKCEAHLEFTMGQWVPGSTQYLFSVSSHLHGVHTFTEVDSNCVYPICG